MKPKINRRKNPHRGIIAEIARELGVKPPTVWQAIEVDKNPKVLEKYAEKLALRTAERKLAVEKYEQALREAV